MKSRAAICVGPGLPLEIDEIDVAGPGPGEVMIEIKAAGLCHSDYHQMDGSIPSYPYPVILGHEGAGVVVDVGPGVTSVKPGDHVIPVSMPECRQCPNCTSGRTNLCLEFFNAFTKPSPFSRRGEPIAQYSSAGTFSNYTCVPEIGVAKIREDAPFDRCCYIGCGVITGVGSVINSAGVRPGSSVIVFGLGGIGLNVIQGARLAGARQIIGVDINPAREEVAKRFGATHFVNPKALTEDVISHLLALTGGGADYTFEAVGNPTLIKQAVATARPGLGVSMLIGAAPSESVIELDPMTMLMGRTFKGAVLGDVKSRTDVPKFVDLYMEGLFNVDDLITHRLPLERINEGFDMMKSGQSIRSVVIF
jgi:S-(hydroxymethyl)glutathione dehydrogenase/alcohol dehydrogenase